MCIPGIGEDILVDPWKIVLELFAYSKYIFNEFSNTLIDICLPYIHPRVKKPGSFRHSARYFILNKKLLGIRVKYG